jgi:multidrug resistance efflux pump
MLSMRRFNVLYIAIPILLFGLYVIYKGLNRSSASFFGVAENQETEINLEHDATVDSIFVTQGQFVTKGTLLLKVTRTALEYRMSELKLEMDQLMAKNRLSIIEIKGHLEQLRAERIEKVGAIQSRIRTLESEEELNKNLFLDLKSVQAADSASTSSSLYQSKLRALHEEMRLTVEPIDAEIAQYEAALKIADVPAQTEVSRLQKEVDLFEKERDQMKVYAPADGLVGSIHSQPGENVQAFNALISFYEQNPNTVVAYLHESLSLKIKVGDSLSVSSSLHPEQHCLGHVSGLGHRIVEIPERLRKIPEIKTYGREVLIQIPHDNSFLQKEKVVLQWINPPTTSLLLFFPWHLPLSSRSLDQK